MDLVQFKPAVEFNERFESLEELGRGRYGAVYKCKDRKTKRLCAGKWLFKCGNSKTAKEDVEREASILSHLSHPLVLQFHGIYESAKEWILLTELLTGCELFDYVTQKDYLEEQEAASYVRNILQATKYLHDNNICHLDIKPENIMLEDPATCKIKLIDFGVARYIGGTSNVTAMVGTPEFAAPEVLNYDPVTTAADMWSIGVLTYILLSGASPFLGDNDGETMQNVLDGEVEFPDEYFNDVSTAAKDLIEGLLISAPKRRTTATEGLKSPWLLNKKHSRIDTSRLKRLKAQRKWMVTLKAIKVSLSLYRMASRKSLPKLPSETCVTLSTSPTSSTANRKSLPKLPSETCDALSTSPTSLEQASSDDSTFD
ncbi:myosin light chain kinase A-like [Dysidea avara]|uniref:myosin light chain kinase A-like n=1 Tax=Dysidea avara TaxID=196820 RepID=UPI00332D11B2